MNKLFKFAGVSALALVTAAPNAFGAFGRFDPYCVEQNVKTVYFLTLNSSGSAKYNVSSTMAYYDVNSNEWCKDDHCTQKYTKPYELLQEFVINDATGLTVKEKAPNEAGELSIGEGELTTKLISYGAMYLGSNDRALAYVYPDKTDKTYLPFQSLTTGSTCSFSGEEYAATNIIAPGQSTGAWAFNTSATTVMPTLVGTGSPLKAEEQAAIIATDSIYYVVRYAADCVSEEVQEQNRATCSLSVNATGMVNYRNTCETGSKADAKGFASPMDYGTCGEIEKPTNPDAMTGNESDPLPDRDFGA